MKKLIVTLIAMALVFALLPAAGANSMYTYDWNGINGLYSQDCTMPDADDPRYDMYLDGWIHWVFNTKGLSTDANLVLTDKDGKPLGTYSPGEPLNANVWHFYTPYYDLENLKATINLNGAPGKNSKLVISDYCPGGSIQELIDISKTAETSYTREHFWDIEKKVTTEDGYKEDGSPKIWLYTDGSGDEKATWTVDVTYKGYEDSDWAVSGEITITNSANVPIVVTKIEDTLAETPIDVVAGKVIDVYGTVTDVDCTKAVEVPASGQLICTYSKKVYVEGSNVVYVTYYVDEENPVTETAIATINWEDAEVTKVNDVVNIQDISDLFGTVNLGTVTAPNNAQFTYYKDFAWAYYGAEECGDFRYDNTATIVETKQSASATLLVNVQCFVFDGETAWAANELTSGLIRYVDQGNWATYVAYTPKITNLFAGQTTPVGTVAFSEATGGFIDITVKLDTPWEFEDVTENLKVQDYAAAPSDKPEPGRFAWKKTCDPAESACTITVPLNNFYGVHVNVGQWIPDPDFGPV
ncbi:MAG: hypothetical protein A4E24_00511 [Methanomethylovorans sp. PtaU1.Bin093]|jgi:hypothetical protein|uniref:hypothetical protein n=1 Tax=Methanomethylovorans sp. PtaU1.Bin093 TaxID=1811679 RepID=UPI0009CBE229|nr:hypothetical protein [Methanomethylovorans sp. PtaU1.Bin093]OPY21576.1 MAG: hypothetical protein A4E24_00511 [Methanomethylovorans sp. PtaU1.Bin093]